MQLLIKNFYKNLARTIYYTYGWLKHSLGGVNISNKSQLSPFAKIASGCSISGCIIAKDVEIKKGTYISTGIIQAACIGEYVSIGPEVLIGLTEHNTNHWTLSPIESRENGEKDNPTDKEKRLVIIENGCWIGARSTLLQGVNIGTGSIVAAGSVVTKNIPSMEIWGGIPARKIKNRKIIREKKC